MTLYIRESTQAAVEFESRFRHVANPAPQERKRVKLFHERAARGTRHRIPHASPRDGELHLKKLGVHVCGFETSPYGVEWMRFDAHCQVPEIVKTLPHLAFVVDNLDTALQGKQILIPPNSPSPGVRVAFILDDGAPIELLELERRG